MSGVSGDVDRNGGDNGGSVVPNAADDQPVAAASAILFRGDSVLLVLRSGPRGGGLWSFPGGHVEAGETAAEAARREAREETGLEAVIHGRTTTHHLRATGRRYAIAVFHGTVAGGVPRAGGDAADARLVPVDAVGALELTPGAVELIQRARELMSLTGHDTPGGGE